MSMNTANKGKDIFDNDFEVIYEGDLPDINIDTDDNYKMYFPVFPIWIQQSISIMWKKIILLHSMRRRKNI